MGPSLRCPEPRTFTLTRRWREDALTSETSRDAALRAFLSLLAQEPFERIDLVRVADEAGVPLSELRATFASPRDLLAAFFRATDRHVLAAGAGHDQAELADEPAQERLFEVLMRRLDAWSPTARRCDR